MISATLLGGNLKKNYGVVFVSSFTAGALLQVNKLPAVIDIEHRVIRFNLSCAAAFTNEFPKRELMEAIAEGPEPS